MHVAFVTAGGAGMFCGSCMHDNTWARALQTAGAEVSLLPTYTPLRVDEADVSTNEIFLGGINVYLDYSIPFWRRLPRRIVQMLDAPWLLNFATRFGVSNDASKLAELLLAMLDGESGPQKREVATLASHLADSLRPDVIVFSNAMLVGAVRTLREKFSGPVFCVLQGDDIFLEELPEPYRTRAIGKIRERAEQFDGFLVHSAYYRDFMSQYLGLPLDKFQIVPLGIDPSPHDGQPERREGGEFTIGYFARVCPEKGLHQLIDAFEILHSRQPQARLRVGGYLGKRNAAYFERIRKRTQRLGSAFEFVGSPETRHEKVAFFKSVDVLSVPTVYREPKGLYVLEAMANGRPVVQPRHGAFPEIIEQTGGGMLVEPANAAELASAFEELMFDEDRRLSLARTGHVNVRQHYSDVRMANETLAIFRRALSPVDQAAHAQATPVSRPAASSL